MADPLSISASVLGILSFGIQICQGLIQYYSSFQSFHESIASMTSTLEEQEKNITLLRNILQKHNYPPDVASRIEQAITALEKPYKELHKKLQKIRPPEGEVGRWERIKVITIRTVHPFRESTLKDIRTIISESTVNLTTALHLSHMESVARIDDEVREVHQTLNIFEGEFLKNKYITWLKPPDPSGLHADALDKQVGGTGKWFLGSPAFRKWKAAQHSLLWLHGIPGSGKTLLSSIIISELDDSIRVEHFLGFFYFDWQIPDMTHADGLLRSLIGQIYALSKVAGPREEMEKVWASHNSGVRQPTLTKLTKLFLDMVSKLSSDAYIVIDALDECSERQKLLKLLTVVSQAQLANLHLLIVSREDVELEEAIMPMSTISVSMDRRNIDPDIHRYITQQLEFDPSLRKRPAEIKAMVLSKLMTDVKGMFRLAEFQLDILRDCGSEKDFNAALSTMPDTLDGVYERILKEVPKTVRSRTRTLLMWLCFSNRPLRLQEVKEIFTVDLDATDKFDIRGRAWGREDALKPLGSLVTTRKGFYSDGTSPRKEFCEFVLLSHYSVKEYLTSDRICESNATNYFMSLEASHAQLASVCITYLLHFDKADSLQLDTLRMFPLQKYAAQYWISHSKAADVISNSAAGQLCWTLSTTLLDSKDPYENTIRVHDPDHEDTYERDPQGTFGESNLKRKSSDIPRPIYVVSAAGWLRAVEHLLSIRSDVNCQGGWAGTPLGTAVNSGNKQMVEFLISRGADVNEGGRSFLGPPLEIASRGSQLDILEILLQNGADINARYTAFAPHSLGTTALFTAVSERNIEHVRFLLEHGADPNIICQDSIGPPDQGQTALDKALEWKLYDILDLLRQYSIEIPQSVLDADLVEACQLGDDVGKITDLLKKKAAVTAKCFIAVANGSSTQRSEIIRLLAETAGRVVELNKVLQQLMPGRGITSAALAGMLLASHMKFSHETFQVNDETLASAARNHDVLMMETLLPWSEKTPAVASGNVVASAAANIFQGRQIITFLDRRFHGRLEVNEKALQIAAANPLGPAILNCLFSIHPTILGMDPRFNFISDIRHGGLARRPPFMIRPPGFHDRIHCVGNTIQNPRSIVPLQSYRPPLITPRVLVSAARYGPLINMVWLLKHFEGNEIPEECLVKAALSKTEGMVVLLLAVSDHLDSPPTSATGNHGQEDMEGLRLPESAKSFLDELKTNNPPKAFKLAVSETVLAAAAQNYKLGQQLVAVLLDHLQLKIKVTSRSLIAAISSYNLFDKQFKPAALKAIVKRLVQTAGGSILVDMDAEVNKMSGNEYEDTVPEHKPVLEVFLVRYAHQTIQEDEIDNVFQYLEESQREIGNTEVMVINGGYDS